MTYPAVPVGQAPVPPTFRSEMDALRRRVDELSRHGVAPTPLTPICRVKLNVDAALAAATDTYAQNNWGIGEDPDGIATLSASAGTNSYVTIAKPGRYLCQVRGVFTAPASSTTCAAYIIRNGTSIVRDNRNSANYGGDGTIVHGTRSVYLNVGDVLNWGHWSNAACTLSAVVFGVPTEMSISWLGTR